MMTIRILYLTYALYKNEIAELFESRNCVQHVLHVLHTSLGSLPIPETRWKNWGFK